MAVPATGRNRRVALLASGVAVAMLGLAFASVPLYRMFCQVTGFGGTTQRAEAAPQVASASSVSVRFDANTSNHLAWSFHPAQTTMNVKFGEQAMAQVQCPVLFVLGAQDQMTSPKAAQGLIAIARNAGRAVQVVNLPVGHHQMTEAPDGTLMAIRDFLAR